MRIFIKTVICNIVIYIVMGLFVLTVVILLISCNSRDILSYTQEVYEPDLGMILIPEGEFIMGNNNGIPDEKPEHVVFLDDYLIDQHLVTNSEYYDFWIHPAGGDSSRHTPADFEGNPFFYENRWPQRAQQRPNHPVVGVSFGNAMAYARWHGKRLPTEAEWEKAARGIDRRLYPWGNEPPSISGKYRANYSPSSSINDDGFWHTSPVGYYNGLNLFTFDGRSPYGIFDMAGNVLEWTMDWYSSEYYSYSPTDNPTGPTLEQSNRKRVARGGSWDSESSELISTKRFSFQPYYKLEIIGFRLAESSSK